MDDNAKNASSYQHDQEILDARGINMTVEDVAGLPTCKYSERVQSLNLNEDDLMFLKGLRRRIRNRLASQNSRRRSMENLRRLTRELRAVRACRDDTVAERRVLLAKRSALRSRCVTLRAYILRILQDRSDETEVPEIDPERIVPSPQPDVPYLKSQVFECRIDKLVQQSVNHMYKEKDKIERDKCKTERDEYKVACDEYKMACDEYKMGCDKYQMDNLYIYDQRSADVFNVDGRDLFVNQQGRKGEDFKGRKERVCAKTVFIGTGVGEEVLNLSKKKSHGRKQSAPRRITYVFTEPDEDGVLDLKIKREPE
ncbi:uncharacterized protein LOC119838585 [Zerene cesonia]|uniref:uncharacterized protein LOC119838585 n=1 Tax=Zerene cesonia TaxID=33412 RepID=UPI0018E52413|nr:uncharacterized protein LOC119838585 [Zerene cesonia]